MAKELAAMEKEEANLARNDDKGLLEPLLGREPSGENRVIKAKSIMELARALSRKFSSKEGIESDHESQEEPKNYCPICYTNEIVLSPTPANQNTWEFTCGHRFCVECTREDMRIKINQFDIEKLICLQD